MKEKYIVDEIETAMFLTLSQDARTVMSKLVKQIALLCSIQGINLKTFGREAQDWR